MPSNPPFPFGAGGPEDGLGALDPPFPLGQESPLPAPVAPPPASLVPEAVRSRAASDLPFDLGGGASPFSASGPSRGGRFDADTEGIPTGLPDLGVLLGHVEAPEAEVAEAPRALPGRAPDPLPADDDLMALPSPSMIEPSPFAPEEPPEEAPEVDDDGFEDLAGAPGAPAGGPTLASPPPPRGAMVPAEVLFQALREAEERATRRMVLAFVLGCLAAAGGFAGARWALALGG